MNNLRIVKSLGILLDVSGQLLDQVLRLSATGTDKDTIPGMDMAENHLLGYNFMLITASPTEILIFMVFFPAPV